MTRRIDEGGCHCGALRFRVEWDEETEVILCNCSICKKKGFLHLIVPEDRFQLISGATNIQEYRFNTGVAVHKFCKTCGIHAFYTPRSHPDCVDINVHCLDHVDETTLRVVLFDGQKWEDNIDSIR